MPGKSLNLAVAIILPAVLLAAAYAQAQAPEPPAVSEESLRSGLTEREKRVVEAYIKYWTEVLAAAENEAVVLTARNALLDGCRKHSADPYQDAYADKSAQIVTDIIRTPPAKLAKLKEVNVAMFFADSQMRRVATREAYAMMVVHANPAVRHLGWQAYRAICSQVIALERPRAQLLALLRTAGGAEESPLVAEEIFRTLSAPVSVIPMTEQKLAEVRKELLEIFQFCWLAWCKRVLAGHADAAEACQVGLGPLWNTAALMDRDQAVKTTVLQMTADILWCSSKAYQEARAAGATGRANAALLLLAEKTLAALTGVQQDTIAQAMSDTRLDLEEKGDEARRHALDWIDQLATSGVNDPADKFQPKPQPQPEPETQPATSTAPGS